MAKLKPQHQQTFETGIYQVDGIDRWISTDSNGTPIWVDQQWGDDFVLVARYATYKMVEENGEMVKAEGPPGSIQPHELALFVAAFGGNPSELPSQTNTTKALLVAEKEINASEKEVKVKVGKSGWISYLYDMSLPKGLYAFRFDGMSPKNNGKPYWRENKRYNTESTIVHLKVVGEVVEGEIVDSPFEGAVQDAWLTKTPLYIMRAVIPQIYESLLGDEEEELENLQTMAYEEDAIVIGEIGYRNKDDNNPRLLRSSLKAYTGEKPLPDKPSEKPVDLLKAVIEEQTDGEAFSGDNLTTEGKNWCKENLKEPCEEHGIPKEFDRMTKDDVYTLLMVLGEEERANSIDTGEEEW